ncbi:hypothetical protein [Aureivirga sp. CE67]|uniref:hypothetical protein n=1 Tax=Aureivirga sp. CE67 TaxID=1788983 RepID=UPI0018C8E0F8|nr:hypothetical protein [Aureivirga sp. CE67]
MKQDNLDAFFKKSFENKEEKVSEESWKRLEFMLDNSEENKKKKSKKWYYYASAAVLFLGIGLSYFFQNNLKNNSTDSQGIVSIETKKDTVLEKEEIQEISIEKQIIEKEETFEKIEIKKVDLNKEKPILEIALEQKQTEKENEIEQIIEQKEIKIEKEKENQIKIDALALLAEVENELEEIDNKYVLQNPDILNKKMNRQMLDSVLLAELDMNFKSTGVKIDSEVLLAEIETEIDFDNSVLDRGVLALIKKKIKNITVEIVSRN